MEGRKRITVRCAILLSTNEGEFKASAIQDGVSRNLNVTNSSKRSMRDSSNSVFVESSGYKSSFTELLEFSLGQRSPSGLLAVNLHFVEPIFPVYGFLGQTPPEKQVTDLKVEAQRRPVAQRLKKIIPIVPRFVPACMRI